MNNLKSTKISYFYTKETISDEREKARQIYMGNISSKFLIDENQGQGLELVFIYTITDKLGLY